MGYLNHPIPRSDLAYLFRDHEGNEFEAYDNLQSRARRLLASSPYRISALFYTRLVEMYGDERCITEVSAYLSSIKAGSAGNFASPKVAPPPLYVWRSE